MFFDIGVNSRITVRAGGARRDVMKCLRVLNSELPAQFAAAGQNEFLDVVAIGRHIIIAKEREHPPFSGQVGF